MPIPPIGGLGVASIAPAALRAMVPAAPAADDGGAAFGGILTRAVESLSAAQQRSAELAIRAVTGDLDDVHDYTIAATEAQVALELTAAVRNKAVDAFNEIMRMQA